MCKATAGKLNLAFVAGGAVLRVDVIHRDFKHVVAADADAMNFHRSLVSRLFTGRVVGVCGLLLFGHGRILAQAYSSGTS
jgi:hypothetical protein